MPGLLALHVAYAGSLYLYMVNEGLDGAAKQQIEAFLGVASIGLLIWIWVSHGFIAALIALMLTLIYVPLLKPAADWTSDQLMGRGKAPKATKELKALADRLDPGESLAAFKAGGVEGLSAAFDQKEKVKQQLFDLCRRQPETGGLIEEHGASDHDLERIYSGLVAAGCGQRVGRHMIAASALVYPETLKRALDELKASEPDWNQLCIEMLDHFGAFG